MHPTPTQSSASPIDKLSAWFTDFIADLQVHELAHSENVLSPEKERFFKTMASGDTSEIAIINRLYAQKYFVQKIIFEFVEETKNVEFKNLAFDYNDSKILTWATINDDDDDALSDLILAKSKVNSKFAESKFYIDLMVLETGDQHPIPSHYHELKLNN